MSAATHPSLLHPAHAAAERHDEAVFIVSPAEAYARAFARAGLPVPASLAIRLPLPLSDASDDDLHRLLAQLDDREAALTQVGDRLARLLPETAEERVLYGPLLRAGLESTTAVRDCLLLELNWRTTRAVVATAARTTPGGRK